MGQGNEHHSGKVRASNAQAIHHIGQMPHVIRSTLAAHRQRAGEVFAVLESLGYDALG